MDPDGDSDSCFEEADEQDMAEVVDLNEMEGGGKVHFLSFAPKFPLLNLHPPGSHFPTDSIYNVHWIELN